MLYIWCYVVYNILITVETGKYHNIQAASDRSFIISCDLFKISFIYMILK